MNMASIGKSLLILLTCADAFAGEALNGMAQEKPAKTDVTLQSQNTECPVKSAVASYSKSKPVKKLMTIANQLPNKDLRNVDQPDTEKDPKKGTGYQALYVRQALTQAGFFATPVKFPSGVRAGPVLKSAGFANLLDCEPTEVWKFKKLPDDLPLGAVVIWRNPKNPRHPGAMAIRTPKGCVSDTVSTNCDWGASREMVGVWVKTEKRRPKETESRSSNRTKTDPDRPDSDLSQLDERQ